jgi:hypothetical protein
MSQPHLKLSPEERSVRRMARKLSGQVELDHILSTVRPGMQNAVFEQIKPWLTFTPDCIYCGRRKMGAMDHECASREPVN